MLKEIIIVRHKKCILYDWAMSQKLQVKKFKWVKDKKSIDKKLNKFI